MLTPLFKVVETLGEFRYRKFQAPLDVFRYAQPGCRRVDSLPNHFVNCSSGIRFDVSAFICRRGSVTGEFAG